MMKGFYEATLENTDGVERIIRCYGLTKQLVMKKLLKEFPQDKIIKVKFLRWCED